MQSGEAMAIDIALLVKNNFEITDAEVSYMKSLTFNEMEADSINKRLMDVGNGVALNAAVTNVYIIMQLNKDEYRYCPDEESAAFLGFAKDTPLDGVWLLNGKIDDNGVFKPATRDDIYRYTALNNEQLLGMENRTPFGTFTTDAWGSFITGYAPIYTTEGSFVGLLGIDMDPDAYQSSAQHMVILVIAISSVIILLFSLLAIVAVVKYSRVKELERQFAFYSDMSHEMRTPLNGILGMATLSKDEAEVAVLHHNFELVESSGQCLLELVNKYLQLGDNDASSSAAKKNACLDLFRQELKGKLVLLCEDHPINVEIIRKILEKAECRIEHAENGKLGLDMFCRSPENYYDAILMDIRMPVMDGIEATQQIRAQGRNDAARIPIIAVTANSYEEDIKKTKAAGMNAHLSKPVNPDILYQALSAAISDSKRNYVMGGQYSD